MNRTLTLYATLLLACTIDHFYQIGRVDEARHATERAEQATTEAYVVTDALLTKYERLRDRNRALNCRISTLAKANRMMLDRMSEDEIGAVMQATLPPMERNRGH